MSGYNKTNAKAVFYYEGLTISTSVSNKLFRQAYAMINICNAMINRAENVKDGDASKIKVLVGEARTLCVYYYLVLVTQYGPVALTLDEATNSILTPQRNTVGEIYAQIISDFRTAAAGLDVNPFDDNYACISKKAALGLLTRSYA
ncbi:MAG: RagB/SusD family nutrient uptake outer membrane protein [Dysgonomonas sp.]|nr:RagB/SusD family nutrient uptake outer membrane protein [Dysgonomonas sp.]